MLTLSQLHIMCDMQNTTNTVINKDWVTANNAWCRAAHIEIVELFDHVGQWKWWKKMGRDLEQGQIELVDVIHFLLSAEIVKAKGDTSLAAKNMFDSINESSPVVTLDGQTYFIDDMPFLEQLDLISALYALKRTHTGLFMRILIECEMDGDILFAQYVTKNTLNMFRQKHGYKTGEYVKEWPSSNGAAREDNIVMMEIAGKLDILSPTFSSDLFADMETYYLNAIK